MKAIERLFRNLSRTLDKLNINTHNLSMILKIRHHARKRVNEGYDPTIPEPTFYED
jgi:hypothetical protein